MSFMKKLKMIQNLFTNIFDSALRKRRIQEFFPFASKFSINDSDIIISIMTNNPKDSLFIYEKVLNKTAKDFYEDFANKFLGAFKGEYSDITFCAFWDKFIIPNKNELLSISEDSFNSIFTSEDFGGFLKFIENNFHNSLSRMIDLYIELDFKEIKVKSVIFHELFNKGEHLNAYSYCISCGNFFPFIKYKEFITLGNINFKENLKFSMNVLNLQKFFINLLILDYNHDEIVNLYFFIHPWFEKTNTIFSQILWSIVKYIYYRHVDTIEEFKEKLKEEIKENQIFNFGDFPEGGKNFKLKSIDKISNEPESLERDALALRQILLKTIEGVKRLLPQKEDMSFNSILNSSKNMIIEGESFISNGNNVFEKVLNRLNIFSFQGNQLNSEDFISKNF